MKIKFLKGYPAKTASGGTKTIAAGTVLDLSPDKASRLIASGVGIELEAVISICRVFFEAANKVYRGVSTPLEAWELYKEHLRTAESCLDEGRIVEAQGEFERALRALQIR